MKKLLIALFFLLPSTLTLAYEVHFGIAEKAGKRNSIQIVGVINEKVYVYRFKLLPLGVEKHTISQYDPQTLETIREEQLDLKKRNLERILIFNGRILIFQNEKDSKTSSQSMYYDVYDGESLSLFKAKTQVAEFEFKKGLFNKYGSFKVILSDDRSKFGAYYDLPYAKGEAEKFGISVFDQDFQKTMGVEVSLPVTDELMTLGTPHLSNAGKFYISAREVIEKNFFGRPSDITHHIYGVSKEGELSDYKIDLVDKYIYEYTYGTNEKEDLICTGLFGIKGKSGVAGGFYVRMDGSNGQIAEASYKDFPLEFITAGWSDKEKQKAEKKQDKGKGNPTLYSYDIRDIVPLADGSAIFTAEQFYIRVVTTVDSQGNRRTTYYYYYNDIIALKLNKEGKFEWYAKIPKHQVSANDGGYYSSYSFHVGKDKIYFMFNDNLKNFESGNAVGGKTYPTNFKSNKYNVTSMVEMNIDDGQQTKRQLFSKSELKTIAVPKIYWSDEKTDMLYFFSKKSSSERLGKVTF